MKARGFSLLELMLALTVTAMVATAIAGMMGAVSSGTAGQSDLRKVSVLANAASSRLNSYIVPSRCVLSAQKSDAVLWLNDSRESGTVHASEIRWLSFDGPANTLSVHYVTFPAVWTKAACDLADLEYSADTNWDAVFTSYAAQGWMSERVLIDELADVNILIDTASAVTARFMTFELIFCGTTHDVPMMTSATIGQHTPPTK